MKRVIPISSIVIAGLATVMWSTPARANDWNELTYFTFSAPVALPGVVLPAGTYIFKHLDSLTDRQVVQVFSRDGRTIYGTFLTIPESRSTPTDEPRVILEEMPAGAPEAIKAWFYPGNTIGGEFIYPLGQKAKQPDAAHLG